MTQTDSSPAVEVAAPEAPAQSFSPEELAAKAKRDRKRHAKRALKRIVAIGVFAAVCGVSLYYGIYTVPIVLGVFLLFGILDVLRNRPLTYGVVDRYFFGNGVLTWLLAPFNLLTDLLSLPYWNKGIYNLEDLPELHQRELNEVLDAARSADLIAQLEDKITDGRSMIFFKWYGKDLRVSIDVPEFHKKYKTIRTIGVSVFNKRKSTSWHYGPLRATFRVLYNLRPTPDNAAFIECQGVKHYWNDAPLYIFDDTLMHQSRNESDHVRYCMFIDIVRPNAMRPVMDALVAVLQVILIRINRTFYKRWAMIK
ncbi:MAG: aspartyl/asparaginyl beta-hydroxylase domain-containing protein [Planctomycetota bacterium]